MYAILSLSEVACLIPHLKHRMTVRRTARTTANPTTHQNGYVILSSVYCVCICTSTVSFVLLPFSVVLVHTLLLVSLYSNTTLSLSTLTLLLRYGAVTLCMSMCLYVYRHCT